MQRIRAIACALAVLASAGGASAALTVTYDAQIDVNWNNSLLGSSTDTDPGASVTVVYDGAGNFEITGISFSAASGALGGRLHVLNEDPGLVSGGSFAGNVATGRVNYVGTADLGALGGPVVNLTNSGGQYTGTASGLSGSTPIFAAGDLYELTLFNQGSYSPNIGQPTNYDHLSALDDPPPDSDFGTRIIFPEPATLGLIGLGGLAVLRRRR